MTDELGPDPWEERLEFGQLFLRHLSRIRTAVAACRPAAAGRGGLPGDDRARRDDRRV